MYKIKLIKPTINYVSDIEEFKKEILTSNDKNKFAGCANLENFTNIEDWIFKLAEMENIDYTANDLVPSSVYLAIRENDNKIVGIIDLRHHINHPILSAWGGHIGYTVRPSERSKGYATQMLKLNLENCKQLGINKVMISARDNNLPSNKVIQNNGGELSKSVLVEDNTYNIYWIKL